MHRLNIYAGYISDKDDYIYSVPIGPKPKGQTAIHRKPSNLHGLLKLPLQITSLSSIWDKCVKQFSQNPYIEDFTYRQVDGMVKSLGSWMLSRNHKVFFLYSKNRPQWTVSDITSWNFGLINVPLYDTLGHEAFDYILRITQGTLIIAEKKTIHNLTKVLSQNRYNIRDICILDGYTKEEKEKLAGLGAQIFSFQQCLKYENIVDRPKLNLETQVSYCFTSGTTGVPKGVIYTHRMGISQFYALKGYYELRQTDVHLSYLPIAHIFERLITWLCTFFGANIRYARYPAAQLFKDLAICKPTTIPMVPRLLNKFYLILKDIYQKEGNYNKIRQLFGGRLRSLITASAPASPHILSFYSQSLGIDLRQCFGQTETGFNFITAEGDRNYGHVGGPNSTTEFKLIDVPQLNYFTDDNQPKGQICMRGGSIFSVYFKDPKNTLETVEKDGWIHTGDIGLLLPNGALKIIDRRKNIYKLQQGQYIAPQKIENVYARCKYVAQSFIYGLSNKDYNIGIIHPNVEHIHTVAQKLGIKEKNLKTLCENKEITKFILQEITKQGQNDGLMSFEQAKKIKLWHQPFQVAGIVTNTMKLQRNIAKVKFKQQLQELYKEEG